MSGILDSKTRVLDTIVTLEGRRQLATGGINIRYVSFTDAATYYAADIVSGSADATLRLYLESCNLPQDQVTFQADSDGRLLPYASNDSATLRYGQLIQSNLVNSASNTTIHNTTLSGEEFHERMFGILTGSIDNFRHQMPIGTKDPIFDDEGFAVGNNEIEFTINDDRPIRDASQCTVNINNLEDVFADPRFSHLQNFKYLPPVNKIDSSIIVDKSDHRQVSRFAIGNYVPWGRSHVYPVNHLTVSRELSYYARSGLMKVVNFEPTSRMNNLFIQAFEASNDAMTKLDIIDFGTWYTPSLQPTNAISSDDPGPVCQIFFVGKLLTKPEMNTHTFVHLFTMIFG